MRRLTVALACVALTLAAGCGGEDEDTSSDPGAPVPTIPDDPSIPGAGTDTETGTETGSGGATAPPTEPPSGGAPAPPAEPPADSGGAPAPPAAPEPAPDSPTNDVAPPPGSPAERAEQFCDENPDAC